MLWKIIHAKIAQNRPRRMAGPKCLVVRPGEIPAVVGGEAADQDDGSAAQEHGGYLSRVVPQQSAEQRAYQRRAGVNMLDEAAKKGIIPDIKKLGAPYQAIRDAYRISVPDTAAATQLIIKYPQIFRDYEITKGKMDDVFLSVTGKKLTGGNEA